MIPEFSDLVLGESFRLGSATLEVSYNCVIDGNNLLYLTTAHTLDHPYKGTLLVSLSKVTLRFIPRFLSHSYIYLSGLVHLARTDFIATFVADRFGVINVVDFEVDGRLIGTDQLLQIDESTRPSISCVESYISTSVTKGNHTVTLRRRPYVTSNTALIPSVTFRRFTLSRSLAVFC